MQIGFMFQSTLPRGERLCQVNDVALVHFVSIHAPTRGATLLMKTIGYISMGFNPRSHAGSDPP